MTDRDVNSLAENDSTVSDRAINRRCWQWLIILPLLFSSHSAAALFIIAHRGAPFVAPENTLPALQKAIEMQANALEVDLRLTKDGHLVLMHDRTVNRTTNGRGKLERYSLAELRALDAGSHFDEQFSDVTVPTLAEVLALPRNEAWLILELKETGKRAELAEQQLLSMLAENKPERVILKSFDRDQLTRLRTSAPEYPQLYVMLAHYPALNFTIATAPSFHDPLHEPVQWLQWHRAFLNQDRVSRAQAAGKRVIAWSVNDDEDIIEMLELGVDGIETDRPDRVRELWRQRQADGAVP